MLRQFNLEPTTEIFTPNELTPMETKVLSVQFLYWYQSCLASSYHIGPITEDVINLWADIKTIEISATTTTDIYRLVDKLFTF
jgi:hypothetical protein